MYGIYLVTRYCRTMPCIILTSPEFCLKDSKAHDAYPI
jgi:hypothetical protein